jgi:hypothetical protein
VLRNVGIKNSDAGELSRRKHRTFRTERKFEIKNNLGITQKSAVLCYFATEALNHAPVCYMTSLFGSSVQDLNRGPWPVIEEIDENR